MNMILIVAAVLLLLLTWSIAKTRARRLFQRDTGQAKVAQAMLDQGPRSTWQSGKLHIVRDLCDGWLWVGGGVTRGFGHLKQVKATSMTLNCTSDFAVPPGFHSTAQTPARGRTKLTVAGPLDFYSLNWLWEQAEQAWKATPSQEGAA